ncbi:type I-E CRISPR-associated protein Cse1/CasA [Peptococcus simiae]|uniref:Type I-E CRISPR-associated protein Cse1/CasA n=1 Tax=Peptococcus simiae TaxID=1643805 RepID=A0ABW9H078_9FIRM
MLKRFNLIDEGWIRVLVDDQGHTREVSLKDLFAHAHEYKGLAGDMKTQDFAVLRMLLALLHTVFSRVDAQGNPYEGLQLDDRYLPTNQGPVDDPEAYAEALLDTWFDLWDQGSFPEVLADYLNAWHDRFYLFDEEYPFFQVSQDVVAADKLSKSAPSLVSGKNINRLISESGNKIALFSPKYVRDKNKEILTSPEVIRWLLTFQGYSGLSDKVIFGKDKYKASKGWLFDLGGTTLAGDNLFQTLMLNFVALHPDRDDYSLHLQRPCWEYHSSEVVSRLMSGEPINNLAELYTTWSRAIYIDPACDLEEPFAFGIVKLPDLDHQNAFLEPMTLWQFNKQGDNKDTFTPRKHRYHQALWRSFGLLTLTDLSNQDQAKRKPGIIDWYNYLSQHTAIDSLELEAISMQDDGNATSWVPVNEIYDSLRVKDFILTDLEEAGWVDRINNEVDLIKTIIDGIYRGFLKEITAIRNTSSSGYLDQKVEQFYFLVDAPFRDWLGGLSAHEDKDRQIASWREQVKQLAFREAEQILKEAGPRDYKGLVSEEGKVSNIAIAYNKFSASIHKRLQ